MSLVNPINPFNSTQPAAQLAAAAHTPVQRPLPKDHVSLSTPNIDIAFTQEEAQKFVQKYGSMLQHFQKKTEVKDSGMYRSDDAYAGNLFDALKAISEGKNIFLPHREVLIPRHKSPQSNSDDIIRTSEFRNV